MDNIKQVEVEFGEKETLELIQMINSGKFDRGQLMTYPTTTVYSNSGEHFWNERAKWSEETFGSRESKGPLGCIRHLKEEVDEVLEHLENPPYDRDKTTEELVDCLFLIEDAAFRHGLSYQDFMDAGWKKLEKNKNRVWPKHTDSEVPIKHVKGIND